MSIFEADTTQLPEELDTTLAALRHWYGDGSDGAAPDAAQWRRLLQATADGPVTLLNFFKLRDTADYSPDSAEALAPASGQEAMMRYAAVSGPALARVGGHFVLMGAMEGTLIGPDEEWDVVAIGSYPDRRAVLGLFLDAEYRGAWHHRRAAMARQRVLVAGV